MLLKKMDDKGTFLNLLQRYVDDTITTEERADLMKAISKGTYDKDVNVIIGQLLGRETTLADMDEIRAREILKGILSEQKTKTVTAPKTRFIRRYAFISTAAAVLLIAVISAWYLSSRKNHDVEKTLLSRNEVVRQNVPEHYSGKQYIRLPDGSTVLLNEKSELSINYNVSSEQGLREVYLTGEGYFDIHHDATRPFLVHIGDLTVRVLGTEFNIRAYSGDNEVQVAVTRGKVEVNRDDIIYGVITPDEQIVINTVTDEYARGKIDSESVTSWKNNYLVIDNLDIEDAIQLIAGKYNVSIEIADRSLRKQRITATFLNNEDLDHVLMVVCEVINAKYNIDEQGKIQLTGK